MLEIPDVHADERAAVAAALAELRAMRDPSGNPLDWTESRVLKHLSDTCALRPGRVRFLLSSLQEQPILSLEA